jgi:hypothetical protein
MVPTIAGHLNVLHPPDQLRHIDFHWRPVGALKGTWDLWPIDNPARPHPLKDVSELARPVRITPRTLGVALVSAHEPAQNGRAV